jgi:hypothetical protein
MPRVRSLDQWCSARCLKVGMLKVPEAHMRRAQSPGLILGLRFSDNTDTVTITYLHESGVIRKSYISVYLNVKVLVRVSEEP